MLFVKCSTFPFPFSLYFHGFGSGTSKPQTPFFKHHCRLRAYRESPPPSAYCFPCLFCLSVEPRFCFDLFIFPIPFSIEPNRPRRPPAGSEAGARATHHHGIDPGIGYASDQLLPPLLGSIYICSVPPRSCARLSAATAATPLYLSEWHVVLGICVSVSVSSFFISFSSSVARLWARPPGLSPRPADDLDIVSKPPPSHHSQDNDIARQVDDFPTTTNRLPIHSHTHDCRRDDDFAVCSWSRQSICHCQSKEHGPLSQSIPCQLSSGYESRLHRVQSPVLSRPNLHCAVLSVLPVSLSPPLNVFVLSCLNSMQAICPKFRIENSIISIRYKSTYYAKFSNYEIVAYRLSTRNH